MRTVLRSLLFCLFHSPRLAHNISLQSESQALQHHTRLITLYLPPRAAFPLSLPSLELREHRPLETPSSSLPITRQPVTLKIMSNQPNSPNDFASIPLPPLPAPVQPFLVAQSASQAPQTQLATFSTVDEAVGVAIDGSEIQTSSREPVLARSISKEPEHRQHLNARAATSDLRTQHQWPAYKQSRPGLVRPGTPAPLSINVLPPPPRAAFIEEGPQSPSLSISARSALSFGDAPSTPRAARAKKELKQSIDWTRFSVQFKDHLLGEDEKASAGAGGSSEWLTRKQNIVKRWTRIGVLGVLALVVVVVIIVVACVRNKEDGPTQPKILDAGGELLRVHIAHYMF